MKAHKGRVNGGQMQQVAEEYVQRGGQKEDDSRDAIVVDEQLGYHAIGRHQKSGNALASHHRLRILFGQHRCESIEARLLNGTTDGSQCHCGHVHHICRVGGEGMPGHLADGNEDECGEGHHVAKEYAGLEWRQREHYIVEQHCAEGDKNVRHRHVQCDRATRETTLPVVGGNDKAADEDGIRKL